MNAENEQSLSDWHDCWNHIGVQGDRSCPELTTYIHCRNCPIYSAAGRSLLDREIETIYTTTSMSLLDVSRQSETQAHPVAQDAIVAMIFRIRGEWLALAGSLFREVTEPGPIHTIPHRNNPILLGLVNIRGELQLCISLASLLDLPPIPLVTPAPPQRFLVIEQQQTSWVFPVDELLGLHPLPLDALAAPAATVTKGSATYTKAVIAWQEYWVSLLDDSLLCDAIQDRALP